jgi:predicted metal-dependent hydrolase
VTETITLGTLSVAVTRRAVKHVHLAVYPPDGAVTVVAPLNTRTPVVRAFVATKLRWIRDRQAQLRAQAREAPRDFVTRESHYLWGKRYLLRVVEQDAKPGVRLTHREIVLSVRPRSSREKRAKVLHAWYKEVLRQEVQRLVQQWQPRLGVRVKRYFLQRMKTKWGSCSRSRGHIRLNTELAKKPKDLLEFVVVHEMLHLRVSTHGKRFVQLMDEHYPSWREARQELNALPLAAETWTRADR